MHAGLCGTAAIVVFVVSWMMYRYLAPKGWKEWARAGLVQAFIIAFYAEMYGFPLTLYFLVRVFGLDVSWAEFGDAYREYQRRVPIYKIEPERDYGVLAGLVGSRSHTLDVRCVAEHWTGSGRCTPPSRLGTQRRRSSWGGFRVLREEPAVQGCSRARPSLQDRVRPAVHVRA